MDSSNLSGLVMGITAVGGSLAVGAIAIIVSVPWAMKEKLAKLEAKSKERLALIEKGMDPDQHLEEKKSSGQDPLFWGLLLAGLGLGLFLGYLVALMTGLDKAILTNALSIFLGGVGMIIYPIYRKRSQDRSAT